MEKNQNFYIGTQNAVYQFNLNDLQPNPHPPRPTITDLLFNNVPVPVRGTYGDSLGTSPLEVTMPYTRDLTLAHTQNNFSLEFTGMVYTFPKEVTYRYILEGYDDDWTNTDYDRASATYTNLPPGNYTFRLQAANHSGVWSTEDAVLDIRILPPWYWAPWSKALYAALALGLLYLLYRFQLNRQLAQAEAARLKELDTTKTRLYTNITHEFRTPLTVILGVAEKIRQAPKKMLQEGLELITRNGQNLLRLVDQMLSLSKLEAGTLSVDLVQGDVVTYVRYVQQSFYTLAEAKHIELDFAAQPAVITMDYDPEKLQIMLSNLLSNAIKFTPSGGRISLSLEQQSDTLHLQLSDTGVGIPEDELPHIFNRFYQVDGSTTRAGEGTGIGLALTRELVQLLGGTITAQSRVGEGTTFHVHLPVTREAPKAESIESTGTLLAKAGAISNELPKTTISNGEEAPTVLIVEDNADVATYLEHCLAFRYRIEHAPDGQAGIERALETIPDLIISDVMMPRADGFTLCKTLKEDPKTNHIPIVLLTAKADAESRLSGLGTGADAYLAKPVAEQELKVILHNLLELRRTLQAKYSDPDYRPQTDTEEDPFVQHAREVLLKHLDNPDLSVEDYCRLLAVSRTQLHNKLKAVTGKSSTEFMRSVRIQRAAELLHDEPKRAVKSIAYEVGYKHAPTFNKAFSAEMGMSPSEFRNGRQPTD
jgi:signal transduction histidine kinase/CheY-like chemotaxis protein